MIGIETHQRGQIEGDGEPGLALLQQIAITGVGILGGGEAGELAHGPELAPIHAFDEFRACRETGPAGLDRRSVGRDRRRDRAEAR